jgi:hypothetical protein
MEVAVFAVVFTVIVEKVLQRIYKGHRIAILTTALCVGALLTVLAVAVFEKISLLPVLLIFR